MGVLVGLVVRVTVAVGIITVDVGLVVSVTVGDGVSEGSKVNVGGKGLRVINCVGSAVPVVQLVKIIDNMKSIVSPALFFIDYPYNLLIPVINTRVKLTGGQSEIDFIYQLYGTQGTLLFLSNHKPYSRLV